MSVSGGQSLPVFKTGAFDHSANCPLRQRSLDM